MFIGKIIMKFSCAVIQGLARLFTIPLFFRGILETGTLRWSCRHLGQCKSERDLGRVFKLPRGGERSWEAAVLLSTLQNYYCLIDQGGVAVAGATGLLNARR